jgi:hypothetical protein
MARAIVGQTILPAAAFLGGSARHGRIFMPGQSRLKAGCSHDWLPRKFLVFFIAF